jgi:hypothetical protein
MAKRFTDTNKYRKPFIRGLQGAYKLLWDYLYHDCDHAGIWIVDFEISQIYIGLDMPVNKKDALKYFNKDEIRIIEIDGGSKWFIPSFIEFQYGVLNKSNRAHNSVINILNKYNLLDDMAVVRGLNAPKDKDKDKYKDKELDKDIEMITLNSATEIFNFLNDLSEDKVQGMIDLAQFNGDLEELKKKFSVEYIGRYGLNKTKNEILSTFQSWMNRDKSMRKPETDHDQVKRESKKAKIYPGKLEDKVYGGLDNLGNIIKKEE